MVRAEVKTTYDVTGRLKKEFNDLAQDALSAIVLHGEARAKSEIRNLGAVDTGAAMNSIYSSIPGKSGYAEAEAAAKAARPDVELFPEIAVSGAGSAQALLAVGVFYAVYINFGTAFMGARPFWTLAYEQMKRDFDLVVGPMLQQRKMGK